MKNYIKFIFAGILFAAVLGGNTSFSMAMDGAPASISGDVNQENINQIHKDLLGKVKKLDGDSEIYVGAGYSPAGEPIFFAMERLDEKNIGIWQHYQDLLEFSSGYGTRRLMVYSSQCDEKNISEEDKKIIGSDAYQRQLFDLMCKRKERLEKTLGQSGTAAGVRGFGDMLYLDDKNKHYVAYASTKPIKGRFVPKKNLDITSYTLEDLEDAYADLIMVMGVRNNVGTPTTTHRGIFKNPFYEIQGLYNNISMKLHGWAATVSLDEFDDKKYVLIAPISSAGAMLRKEFKPGELFIGKDDAPFLRRGEGAEEYPFANASEIGDAHASGSWGEPLYVVTSEAMSKRYINR